MITKQRNYSYDIIRILATIMVIIIHTFGGLVIDGYKTSTLYFTFGNFFDSLSQIAVPLFLMLSGALALREDKVYTVKKSLKTSLNIFIILYIWSLFYAVMHTFIIPIIKQESILFNIRDFLKVCLNGHYHQWYLFIIIGLYLITPLLKLFIKKDNFKLIFYFLIMGIVVRFLPYTIDIYSGQLFELGIFDMYTEKFKMLFFVEYLIYYILGWFIVNAEFKKIHYIAIYTIGILSFFVTFSTTHFFAKSNQTIYEQTYSNRSVFILFSTFAAFTFIIQHFKNKNFSKSKNILTTLSSITFGVYLIHDIIRTFVTFVVGKLNLIDIISTLLCFILTTVLSFGIALIISKIPLIKKAIRC